MLTIYFTLGTQVDELLLRERQKWKDWPSEGKIEFKKIELAYSSNPDAPVLKGLGTSVTLCPPCVFCVLAVHPDSKMVG